MVDRRVSEIPQMITGQLAHRYSPSHPAMHAGFILVLGDGI